MYLSIELTESELDRLEERGFLALAFPNGLHITVTKDILEEKEDE